MKISFFVLLFFLVGSVCSSAFSFSGNYVEFDLNKSEIKFTYFQLSDYSLSGDFSLKSRQDQGSLVYQLEGRNVILNAPLEAAPLNFSNKVIPWFTVRLEKRGKMFFLEHFSLPNISIKGNYDSAKSNFFLDISGQWDEDSQLVKGHLNLSAKAWGDKDNFSLSGQLIMEDAIYKGRDFSRIRLDFLGKPPLLNITDSEFILANGTVASIDGERVLDLRNFSNLIPGAEFKVRKAFLDEWQVYSEGKKTVGLKKSLDKNIDISLGADKGETDSGPQTELRYKVSGDNFLKLKMQENSTLLGIENKKTF
ncbi:MAG: hypothetical protein KKH93_00740 [Candidatus Omnitrophica bacterium]|nr:hypothetical protein [Candidatus Omnitrophota bacterium]